MINHRAIKAFLRGEKPMYHQEDIKFIAQHTNNTRYKIDMIGGELDFQHRNIQAYEKMKDKIGVEPQAFHLKHHIRESVAKRYKLAKVVKEALIDRIQNGNIGEWAWLIGVVLLGEDTDVKQAIRRRIREDRVFSPNKIISILGETMVLKGTESVIEIEEKVSDDGYVIECLYRGNIIAKTKSKITDRDDRDISWIKNEVRTKLVNDIFDYFIEE